MFDGTVETENRFQCEKFILNPNENVLSIVTNRL